jgi:hypothetical protein
MIVYEDDLGNPIPIFYHEATDPYGCKLEADLRKEIEDYREESSLNGEKPGGMQLSRSPTLPMY